MKKRILLAALLVIPMGAAFALREETTAYDDAARRENVSRGQSGTQNVNKYDSATKEANEAMFGTQSGMATNRGAQ